MLSFFLVHAMMALVLASPLFDASDAQDEVPDDNGEYGGGDPDGEEPIVRSDDGILVRNGATGIVRGTSDDDTITVTAEYQPADEDGLYYFVTDGPYGYWQTDSGEAPLTVCGSGGDDTMTLSGSGYVATGGAGADTITLDGVHHALIEGGSGDTIYGQDADDLLQGKGATLIELTGDATFIGGSAADKVSLYEDGGLAEGGDGDDVMYAFGTSTLRGGGGNDRLDGDATISKYDGSQVTTIGEYRGAEGDLLDGGAGDDRLSGGYGDTLTGGAGADRISLVMDPNFGGSGAVVTDFDPSTDRLTVNFDEYDEFGGPFDYDGRITSTLSPEGWVEIRGDGELLVTLQGLTSVRIAWAVTEDGPFTAVDGTPVGKDEFDILVTPFYRIMT